MHQVAIIKENHCIGCTKCIAACPVDAIIGSKNVMHTVIAAECIGCKLCIPPCPVDCIEMIPATTPKPEPTLIKRRNKARKERLGLAETSLLEDTLSREEKKNYVLAAIKRKTTTRST